MINTTLNLNSEAYTVIGIAPEEFTFPYSADVWAPMLLDGETATNRQAHYVEAFGRLRPGVSLEDAQTELNIVAARLESDYPDTNSGQGVQVMTLAEGIRDQGAGPFLAVVFASTGLVLLIACVNVANMLLARGAARQKELALRFTHGASVQRIGRLLLTESLLLSLAGTAAALAFAWFGIAVIRDSMPAEIARLVAGWGEIDIDGRLVGFGLGLSLATTIIFGALPAWRAARPDLVEILKEGGRTGDTAGGRSRLHDSLIIGEMALALMLLVAAALTTQGSLALLNGDHGYDPTNVLTLRVTLPDARYEEPNQLRQFFTDTVARLKTLPGVVDAAIVSSLPSSNTGASRPVTIEGHSPPLPRAGSSCQLPDDEPRVSAHTGYSFVARPCAHFTGRRRRAAGRCGEPVVCAAILARPGTGWTTLQNWTDRPGAAVDRSGRSQWRRHAQLVPGTNS